MLDDISISVQEAFEIIDTNDNAYLFDIRNLLDYRQGTAYDAIFFTEESFSKYSEKFDENTIVMFICYRGKASLNFTSVYRQHLNCKIYSIDGGMAAWSHANLPMEIPVL